MSVCALISAQKVSAGDRARLLNSAYVDYPVPLHLTAEQMTAIDRFYAIDLARSVVALVGDEPVGMALLAVRGRRGWVSGVGVIPAQRRRGIGHALMRRICENAAHGGLEELTLEVIAENGPAQRLYAGLGFQPTRELLMWRRPAEADALPVPAERLLPAAPASLLTCFDRWHTQPAVWQRSAATLCAMAEAGRLKGYRLDWHGRAAAYCLVSGHGESLSLMDVAIDPTTDIVTPGRILLQALAHQHGGQALTISNVPADDPLSRVLAALRFLVTMRQIEMRLVLADS